MTDDSDCYPVGQPPAAIVDLADRFHAWAAEWTADLVRLTNRVWWLRDIAPTWPPEDYAAQWADVPGQIANLRAALDRVGLLLDEAEAMTPAGEG